MTTIKLNSPRSNRTALIRAAWILIALLMLAYIVGGLPSLYRYWMEPCGPEGTEYCRRIEQGLTFAGTGWEFFAGYNVAGIAAVYLPFLLLCVLLAWRKSDDPKTVLFLMAVMVGITVNVNFDLPKAVMEFHPAWKIPVLALTLLGEIALIAFYTFPDGRFIPDWTRWTAVVYAVLCVLIQIWPADESLLPEPWYAVSYIATVLAWYGFPVTCAYSMIYRYRRAATPEQRQQIKWVVLSVGWVAFWLIFDILIYVAMPLVPQAGPAANLYGLYQAFVAPSMYLLGVLFVAVSFYIAVFRYRLWDVDFIINRSLAYGALTLILAAAFGIVLFMGLQVFELLTRQPQSTASVAVAALAVGVLFQPARYRILRFVDKRLYHIQIDYMKPAPHPPAVRTGELAAAVRGTRLGEYPNLELIGRGGMAEVYKAVHPTLGQPVAIKLLHPRWKEDPAFHKRFLREIGIVTQLNHPNIVRVYEGGEEGGMPYMVMEYLAGQDLGAWIRTQGPMRLDQARLILSGIGNALDYAHAQGLIHRDIKPSNVMLAMDGGRIARVVLTDFGIAKMTDSATSLTQSVILGTLDYISPEQIHGARDIDGRADIYSFGILVFELLSGRLPFRHNNAGALLMAHAMEPPPDIRTLAPEIPERIALAVKRAMAKKPAERFAMAGEFASALVF